MGVRIVEESYIGKSLDVRLFPAFAVRDANNQINGSGLTELDYIIKGSGEK